MQAGVNTHLAAYLRDQQLSAAFAGIGISLNALCLGMGSIAWGWIVERITARYVMAAIALSVAAASALFITAGTTTEALAYSALFGFGVGGLLSVPPVIYADYYGRRSLGTIRGVAEPLTSFGQAIGAVLSGAVFDLTESYQWAFAAFAILALAAAALVMFARPPQRRPAPVTPNSTGYRASRRPESSGSGGSDKD